jgi:hypothetical protein
MNYDEARKAIDATRGLEDDTSPSWMKRAAYAQADHITTLERENAALGKDRGRYLAACAEVARQSWALDEAGLSEWGDRFRAIVAKPAQDRTIDVFLARKALAQVNES